MREKGKSGVPMRYGSGEKREKLCKGSEEKGSVVWVWGRRKGVREKEKIGVSKGKRDGNARPITPLFKTSVLIFLINHLLL